MKRVTRYVILGCAFFAATAAFTQGNAQPNSRPGMQPSRISSPQQDCPVRFTKVSLRNQAHIMLIRPNGAPGGDLAFQYQNQSGKTIQSMIVRVSLKVKRNVYALDTTDIQLEMMLTGKGLEETLPLDAREYVYAVHGLTLERVSYADGSIWTASAQNTCRYEGAAGAEEIGKLQ